MPTVEARLKIKGKHFEIAVDLDEALKLKNGKGDIVSALQSPNIFYDIKKGTIAAQKDLQEAFSTADIYEIARKIILTGEVQKTQEFRDAERDKKVKQIINLIIKNASDQHGRPYTEEKIKTAIESARIHFDNRAAEKQLSEIIEKLKTVIPIKMQMRKIKLTIPARYTGQVYGILQEYKESEDWLSNGNLQTVISIPAGLLMDFYDKLNSMTHGAIQSEELVAKE